MANLMRKMWTSEQIKQMGGTKLYDHALHVEYTDDNDNQLEGHINVISTRVQPVTSMTNFNVIIQVYGNLGDYEIIKYNNGNSFLLFYDKVNLALVKDENDTWEILDEDIVTPL